MLKEYYTKVSIPHRYGKNPKLVDLFWCHVLVSIPHRYGKNDSKLEADFYLRLFPFLIGTVRTQTILTNIENLSCFHSS